MISSNPYHPLSLQRGITHTWMGESWMVDGEVAVMMMAMISSNSPSRQGARTEFLIPEIGFSMAAELWKVSGKSVDSPEVFRSEALSSPKGSVGGHTGWPHHPWARQGPTRALGACGAPVHPPRFVFWLRGSSGKIEFLEFFWNFPKTLTFCTKTRHQGNSAENSVSPC